MTNAQTNQFTDAQGNPVRLGKRLGQGGEGAVYEVVDDVDTVAKIYTRQISPDHAAKLNAMVGMLNDELLRIAAWPKATLYSRPKPREVCGILIPRVHSSFEVHELYSPAQRKVRFPQADWRFLILTALNCAIVFDKLHCQNIVVGDVNQGNVFVNDRAVVRLIDCDSFQISSQGRIHPCRVGVPEFTPPELQGNANFGQTTRTTNHDCFGLAVLIFHLLFMGRHPFSGRFTGSGEMPIDRAIRENRFAYSATALRMQIQPPPNTLTLQQISPQSALLFEKAFSKGKQRPSADEWCHQRSGNLSRRDWHSVPGLLPGFGSTYFRTEASTCGVFRRGRKC